MNDAQGRKPRETIPEGRYSERALALTIATLVLLTPPILTIFSVPVFIFGIPLLHVYSFTVWLLAIACGGWLATRLGAGNGKPGNGA
jgi:hypothetical protein